MRSFVAVLTVLLAPLLLPLVAHAGDATARVALKGYDTVAYFTEGKALPGTPEFRHDWDGARYHFSSASHRAAFVANPERFAPQFAANCAMGLAAGKIVVADPTVWKIVDGKLYLFSVVSGPAAVDRDPALLERAKLAWKAAR